MPDHWHGLVELGSTTTLSRTIGRAKFQATRRLRVAGVEGAIWARDFHDRAIRRTDDIRAAARYIVANPLRAGLVESIGDYPYWNAAWLRDGDPV